MESKKKWSVRWFTLIGYELKFYKEAVDQDALEIIDLTTYSKIFSTYSAIGRPYAFG